MFDKSVKSQKTKTKTKTKKQESKGFGVGRGAGARDGVSEFTKIPEWFKMMFELFFDPVNIVRACGLL